MEWRWSAREENKTRGGSNDLQVPCFAPLALGSETRTDAREGDVYGRGWEEREGEREGMPDAE